MAKKSRSKASIESRKQASRRRTENKQLQRIYIGVGVLAALIVLILGIGLYQEYYRKPRRALATVNGVPIKADYHEKMVAYREINLQNSIFQLQQQLQGINPNDEDQQAIAQYYQQQIEYYQSLSEQAPQQVLEELINNELIRQGADQLDISVSEEELDLEIEQQFGYDRNPPTPSPTPITHTETISGTPTPTVPPMTSEQFETSYQEAVQGWGDSVGFTEAEFRDLFRIGLLANQVETYLADQIPSTALQVKASHILLETEEDAQKALERLEAGEDFATVALEMSTDESTKENGGDLGWFPLGQMVPDFEKVAFNTPVGQYSEIVPTSFGFHIIYVEDKDENRELDPAILAQKQQGVLDEWLQEQRAAAEITYDPAYAPATVEVPAAG